MNEKPVRQELTLIQTYADGSQKVLEVNPDAIRGLVKVETSYTAEQDPDWRNGAIYIPGATRISEVRLKIEVAMRSPITEDGKDAGCFALYDVPAPERVGPCSDPNCTLDHSREEETSDAARS